jgi:hypothetical protein
MEFYNPKWALILEDKFPFSGNAKHFKVRKRKKGFMQGEDEIITSETS